MPMCLYKGTSYSALYGPAIVVKSKYEKKGQNVTKISQSSQSPLEKRYALIPQMRVYDNIRQHFIPYVCQANPPEIKCETFETDKLGYRISYFNNNKVDSNTWFSFPQKALLLGGSVSFGWGSTSNQTSLSSQLANALDMPVQTLGIMAANSIQEFISGIPFYHESNLVFNCTGANTLYACLASNKTFFRIYSPLYPFNNILFENMKKYDTLSLSYLLSNNIEPKHYFKSKEQKVIFQEQMSNRFWERVKKRFFRKLMDPEIDVPQLDIEEALLHAVKIQTRDIDNMSRIVGKEKFICLIQPFLPSMKKVLSEEEKKLRNFAKEILRPDTYNMQYHTMREIWKEFTLSIVKYCSKKSIRLVDLNQQSYEGWCFLDSGHLTDRGNQLTAQYVKDYIANEL